MKNKRNFPSSSLNKQQGWTMWGLIVALGLVIFFVYIGMKLVPIYNQNMSVKNAMETAFTRVESLRTLKKAKYVSFVQRQLYLDEAHRDIAFQDLIDFRRDKRNIVVTLDYSQVVPLFFNISLKVDFNESITEPIR